MPSNVKTVYKVVRKENGKFYSVIATMPLIRVEYKINKWVQPTEEMQKLKQYLTAFKTLRSAENFFILEYESKVIFKCKAMVIRKHVPIYLPFTWLAADKKRIMKKLNEVKKSGKKYYGCPTSHWQEAIFCSKIKLIREV